MGGVRVPIQLIGKRHTLKSTLDPAIIFANLSVREKKFDVLSATSLTAGIATSILSSSMKMLQFSPT